MTTLFTVWGLVVVCLGGVIGLVLLIAAPFLAAAKDPESADTLRKCVEGLPTCIGAVIKGMFVLWVLQQIGSAS